MTSAATVTQTQLDDRHRSYGLKTPAEHIELYDKWAETYDADVMGSSTEYVGPLFTTQAVIAANGRLDGETLDAGCGTGLAGVALAQAGAKTIDGIDVSPGMLKVAEKTQVYRKLWPVDLSKNIDVADGTYDVVTCVGTFTTSHVKADPAVGELVRVLKKGGVLAATVLVDIWKTEGFESETQRLKEAGIVDVVSTEVVDYRRADQARAVMLVLRRR